MKHLLNNSLTLAPLLLFSVHDMELSLVSNLSFPADLRFALLIARGSSAGLAGLRIKVMGEYAEYNGERIKIGTCENMYYLRADQVHLVTPLSGNVNPRTTDAESIRFRFPFPHEDGIKPGEFSDHDLAVGVWGVDPPADLQHDLIQLSNQNGLLVSLPCPEGKQGKAAPYHVHYNGYSGKVQISQQRLIDGKLVLVCNCGSCGAKYRLETLADAQPVIDALNKEGDNFRKEVAKRIADGYTAPNYWTKLEAAI